MPQKKRPWTSSVNGICRPGHISHSQRLLAPSSCCCSYLLPINRLEPNVGRLAHIRVRTKKRAEIYPTPSTLQSWGLSSSHWALSSKLTLQAHVPQGQAGDLTLGPGKNSTHLRPDGPSPSPRKSQHQAILKDSTAQQTCKTSWPRAQNILHLCLD